MKLVSPLPGLLRESVDGQMEFCESLIEDKITAAGRMDDNVHGDSPMRITCDELDSLMDLCELKGKLQAMIGLDDEARKEVK